MVLQMREGTPQTRNPHANFYFSQDILSSWCATHPSTSWTITRPGFIIGANPSAAINIAYSLAIRASVQRELGAKLDFPSDVGVWNVNKDLTNARLLDHFSEWAALICGGEGRAC